MNHRFEFDEWAKDLARGVSRREALRRLGGGLAGALLASLGLERAWGAPPSRPARCSDYCNTLPRPQRANCNNACKQCGGNTQNICPASDSDKVACCNQGTGCCSGACAPLGTNTNCAGGTVCTTAGCQCPTGQAFCAGACTSLGTNTNCAACGNACTGGTSCVNGTCQCPSGQAFCAGACTPLGTNTNCAACGNACTGGMICVNGACQCPAGVSLCPNSTICCALDRACCGEVCCGPNETCGADGNCHCGTGVACSGSQTCCNGTCVDTLTDFFNCGGCGLACNRDQADHADSCAGGVCRCGGGSACIGTDVCGTNGMGGVSCHS